MTRLCGGRQAGRLRTRSDQPVITIVPHAAMVSPKKKKKRSVLILCFFFFTLGGKDGIRPEKKLRGRGLQSEQRCSFWPPLPESSMEKMKRFKRRLSQTLRGSHTIDESLSELAEQMTIEENGLKDSEPIVRNGRPPSAHSVHSFLHQYTGSFKKPPLRRPQSVIGGGLGSLMVMPRNGSRLDIVHENLKMGSDGESDQASGTSSDEVQSPTGVCLRNRGNRRISAEPLSRRSRRASLKAVNGLTPQYVFSSQTSQLIRRCSSDLLCSEDQFKVH
ncbi:hypothetical protein INR49_025028 [Caranx melampygus]|nr:hypothetical protein INR49_025028 [Caranx melampygus]